jgi:integrase
MSAVEVLAIVQHYDESAVRLRAAAGRRHRANWVRTGRRRDAFAGSNHACGPPDRDESGTYRQGLHSMRHSTGTWLIRAGVDVRTVAALLRHSSPATTLYVYAHEVEGAQADAVRHLLGANGNRMATAVGSDP